MRLGSTIILRGAVVVLGLMGLALCFLALPAGIISDNGPYWPILVGLYLPAMPFFFALYQTWKLLDYIDSHQAFSQVSINALGKIKYCAAAISGLFALGMPYIYWAANQDDAPGVVAIGLVIMGASFVIATSAAVFQSLVQNAVDIKSENDLTV